MKNASNNHTWFCRGIHGTMYLGLISLGPWTWSVEETWTLGIKKYFIHPRLRRLLAPTTHGFVRRTKHGIIGLLLRMTIPLCGFEKYVCVSMPWEWHSRGNIMPLSLKKPLRHPKPWTMPWSITCDFAKVSMAICIQVLRTWGTGHGYGRRHKSQSLKEYFSHLGIRRLYPPTTHGFF